ncbi:hypothetical protein [Actinacidiphila glaucinigra]|uniref:Uncharacterized protein n=1 Tax=Actinacidiphila glaucinigra TaxID=235986 RepID=A0A239MV37_9ACTN|nr:hypothetical protein [Actinacidiphila glaucinigra]SNT46032.1 hypothetical protein SAMN05216252_12771 [Actinacidiphila glaucinigra]
MEAIAGELLMALAGGTAGAAGQQAWMSLRDLVRRPTAPDTGPEGPGEIPSGEEEFAALDEEAESAERAQALARALALRATYDDAFREHFAAWRSAAQDTVARPGGGNVDNSVTGGRQGTVIMGRDFHGPITFNQP